MSPLPRWWECPDAAARLWQPGRPSSGRVQSDACTEPGTRWHTRRCVPPAPGICTHIHTSVDNTPALRTYTSLLTTHLHTHIHTSVDNMPALRTYTSLLTTHLHMHTHVCWQHSCFTHIHKPVDNTPALHTYTHLLTTHLLYTHTHKPIDKLPAAGPTHTSVNNTPAVGPEHTPTHPPAHSLSLSPADNECCFEYRLHFQIQIQILYSPSFTTKKVSWKR